MATLVLVVPIFGYYTPASRGYDFGNHIALVAGALETWRTTHAIPISSDGWIPGTEYPYFLFGNAGFYELASAIGFIIGVPATTASAITLAIGFVIGQFGTYLLARSFGLSSVYSAVLGFLYATSPYLSIVLLVRMTLPEFMTWQIVPLLCFVGRRAMQPNAGVLWLGVLVTVLSLPLYLHKLVGPHIMLFELVLLLVAARPDRGWFARMAFVTVSVPGLTAFAWLPTLRVTQDHIIILNAGIAGAIEVVNDSLLNYVWPWAQDSLPAAQHAAVPEYGDRYALQIGLLASIGFVYGGWRLLRSRLRPRHRELLVAPVGVVVYSTLVLGVAGLVDRLPFPLNTIQSSLRLIGLASFAGLLALIAALSERPHSARNWRDHVVPGAVALAIVLSTTTYWRQPAPLDEVLASIGPATLIDNSSFFRRSFKSLFDTSGAISPDGTLGERPWPMGLAAPVEHGDTSLLPPGSRQQWPRTIFLRGAVRRPDVTLRVYGLRTPGSDSVALATQTVASPGPIDLELSIPEDVFFITIECGASPCLNVEYLGPPNQLDGTVQIPRALPPSVLTRGPFGQWTIRLAGLAQGEYVLPTFDYSFVTVRQEDGSPVPTYQFDSRPVMRFDGIERTIRVGYDLRPEIAVIVAWACFALSVVSIVALASWRRRTSERAETSSQRGLDLADNRA